MNLNSDMGSGFRLKILNGPRFSEVVGILVGKYDCEVPGRSDGGLVGQLAKNFHSYHQTALGSGDV